MHLYIYMHIQKYTSKMYVYIEYIYVFMHAKEISYMILTHASNTYKYI